MNSFYNLLLSAIGCGVKCLTNINRMMQKGKKEKRIVLIHNSCGTFNIDKRMLHRCVHWCISNGREWKEGNVKQYLLQKLNEKNISVLTCCSCVLVSLSLFFLARDKNNLHRRSIVALSIYTFLKKKQCDQKRENDNTRHIVEFHLFLI